MSIFEPRHELALAALRLALPELEEDLNALMECCSLSRRREDGTFEVIPDTLEECAVEAVARKRAAIAAVRTALGDQP